jgi:Holliday junction resolvase RusA-like endonuclease
VWPAVRPDSDKLLRAVLDGLTEAGVWRDDGQVVQGTFIKRYCLDGEPPGIQVEVWALDN